MAALSGNYAPPRQTPATTTPASFASTSTIANTPHPNLSRSAVPGRTTNAGTSRTSEPMPRPVLNVPSATVATHQPGIANSTTVRRPAASGVPAAAASGTSKAPIAPTKSTAGSSIPLQRPAPDTSAVEPLKKKRKILPVRDMMS